jgi:MscS family membrane protein
MVLGELFMLDRYVSNEYVLALIVLVGTLFVFRIFFSLAQKIMIGLTRKTKTDVDDIIVQKSSKPLTLLSLLLAFRFAVEELSFAENFVLIFSRILYSAAVIIVGYIIYVIIDTALIRGWSHLSKKTKVDLDENLTTLFHGTLKFALVILAILYILDLWGVAIGPLLGALGIAGLAVALALQPTLSNIFSGVAMILDKSVRIGDWVVLEDGMWGVVEKIGIRSTKFRTFDNEMLIIPNSKFADSRVQNVSLPEPKARIVLPFGVAYGSDVDKVKKIVSAEIEQLPHIDKSEGIHIRFMEMGDSALKFKAYFYVESFEFRLGVLEEANCRIYKALGKAGIQIPFPQMDVHLKKE